MSEKLADEQVQANYRKAQELLKEIRLLMPTLYDEHRLTLGCDLMEGYCRHCGSEDPRSSCQCWNDE